MIVVSSLFPLFYSRVIVNTITHFARDDTKMCEEHQKKRIDNFKLLARSGHEQSLTLHNQNR